MIHPSQSELRAPLESTGLFGLSCGADAILGGIEVEFCTQDVWYEVLFLFFPPTYLVYHVSRLPEF